jgi:hypothetical protein
MKQLASLVEIRENKIYKKLEPDLESIKAL